MHQFSTTLLVATLAAVPAFGQAPAAPPAPVGAAIQGASEAAIRAHVKFLASDLLEGRGPGTRGDAITTRYIASQFEALGLQPAGDDGSYFQTVSLLGLTYEPERSSVSFRRETGVPLNLKYLEEFVGLDQTQRTRSILDSELVFVGHGVVAPEYNWDDYKGMDVRGKTLVMLVDDPPASAAEPDLFKGKARTYYGRWTYKFEIGAAKGAQAVILIHTPKAAGYGWQVVRNSWGSEGAFTKLGEKDPALSFAGWITEDVARNLFKTAGRDLDALTRAAASRDFRPVRLDGYRMIGDIATGIRTFDTANVVARLEGSDPKLRGEAILYTAHHDHLGIGTPDATGDRIYNGAIDNATGVAIVLELARLWSETTPRPKRSVIFSMVAAEEQGLLGSAWYGRNPSIPAGRIALALNFDAIYMIGRVRDVTMIGVERTTFNPAAERVTKALGLTIVPDQDPEQGFYYRSDHFSLARVGVPAFSVKPGHDVIGKPAGWGRARADEYREKSYHQPSDEVAPDWDWSSGVQAVGLGFWLGWEAAQAAQMPNWLPGEEFRAIRDRSIAAGKSKG